MRIGIASIALEANTFNPIKTTLNDFQSGTLLIGSDVWQLLTSHHEVGGVLDRLQLEDVEVVPLLAALSAPGGTLTDAAFTELRALLREELERAGPLDGLLLAPHGAMVAESIRDADGAWLSDVRRFVGEKIPIIATIDPHANLSPQMVAATDALLAYKTNPHVDQAQRGREAAELLLRTLKGEIRPTQAACFPPIAIEIERQFSDEGAYRELLQLSRDLQARESVLSSSLVLGFPYADVEELGSATVVVTDNDPALARDLSERLGAALWERRDALRSELISIVDAVRTAKSAPGTTCLLEMGDNVGGGSPGDCTILLEEILSQQAGPALAVLIDPEAAAQAHAAGQGRQLHARVGGKQAGSIGEPIDSIFNVTALSDGRFSETEIRHGGQQHFDQGPSAVLQSGDLTLVVISKRCPPFSLQQVTHLGVDPRNSRIIVAKGVHAPVAAYRNVCDRFLRVNTPGITATDMTSFNFLHRRHPLFPLETDVHWQPGVNCEPLG